VLGLSAANTEDKLFYFISGDLSEADVRDYIKQNLPFAWRADYIIKLDEIPKTKNGKPKIAELRQMAKRAVNA